MQIKCGEDRFLNKRRRMSKIWYNWALKTATLKKALDGTQKRKSEFWFQILIHILLSCREEMFPGFIME